MTRKRLHHQREKLQRYIKIQTWLQEEGKKKGGSNHDMPGKDQQTIINTLM